MTDTNTADLFPWLTDGARVAIYTPGATSLGKAAMRETVVAKRYKRYVTVVSPYVADTTIKFVFTHTGTVEQATVRDTGFSPRTLLLPLDDERIVAARRDDRIRAIVEKFSRTISNTPMRGVNTSSLARQFAVIRDAAEAALKALADEGDATGSVEHYREDDSNGRVNCACGETSARIAYKNGRDAWWKNHLAQ